MRRIVCFGDSNTYGCSPVDGSRYGEDIRWPGVLNSLLGNKFEVVNEGKNARTIAFDDPYEDGCNGMNDIVGCIERNEPIDLFVIMLGTNDLKVYFEATPQIIANNLLKMCELVKEKTDAKILLVSPMLLGDQIEFSPLHLEFGREQVDYSFELAPEIEKVAETAGAEFIDLAVVAMSSDVDCLHLMPEEHAKVAQAMYTKVLSIYKDELEQEVEEEEEEVRVQAEEGAMGAAEAQQMAEAGEQIPQAEDALLHVEQLEASGFQTTASQEQIEQWQSEDADESGALLGQIKEIERHAKAILDGEETSVEAPAAAREPVEQPRRKEDRIQFQALVGKVFGEQNKQNDELPEFSLPETTINESAAPAGSDGILGAPVLTEGTSDSVMGAPSLTTGASDSVLGAPSLSTGTDSAPEDTLLSGGSDSILGGTMSNAEMESAVTIGGVAPGPKPEPVIEAGSEKERMITGKLYYRDAELKAEMTRARTLLDSYNRTTSADVSERSRILMSLFWYVGQNVQVELPFHCDYGSNISVGDNFFASFDCIMMDSARIKIGNNVCLGPRVNIFTAAHPIYAPVRNEGFEYAQEVTIGDDVWIGGNVTIHPGVHIGNNVVIGAGSVVTEDIPDGVVAEGNPCRIVRKISDADKQEWEDRKAEREQ